MTRPPRVIILHEWDGKPYYQALDQVVRELTGEPPLYREAWLVRQLGIGLVRRNGDLIRRSLRNVLFLIRSLFLRDTVIVLGMAPFDPTLLLWSRLRRRNRIIYHTSWLKWDGSEVPKRSSVLPSLVRAHWRRFLEDPRVRVVSLLEESRASLLANYRKDPALLSVIPHAVDLSLFRAPSKRPAGAILKVAYVGRLNQFKGIDVLAEVIAQADPTRFAFEVAGAGPEWSRLEPLKGRFTYHGHLDGKAKVAALLATQDVLIMPSVYEQFGIALLEAMACGVVCVASTGLVPKDLVVDGRNGFVAPRTVEAFLAALERLHSDRELLCAFRARGIERAKDFELESVGGRWHALLAAT